MFTRFKKISLSLLLILSLFALEKVQATVSSWDFGTSTDYYFDSNYIQLATGIALKVLDQVDGDNTATGFGGGTTSSAQWVVASSTIQLDSAGKTAHLGTFTSRIFDAGTSTSWTSLVPIHRAPFGKALPSNGVSETAYTDSNADMSNNLALFHFDESSGSFTDYSGNSRTGTASGTITYSQNSIFGTGVSLNGVDNAIVIPGLEGTASSSVMTIEGWFKPTVMSASDVLVSQYNSGVNQRFSWQTHTTADEMILYVSVNPTGPLVSWFSTGADLAAGNWYHLAVVWNGNASTEAGKVTMYVNGSKPFMTKSGANVITQFSGQSGLPLVIGDMQNFHPREFPGSVDEVAVYNRALSDAEIISRYKRGALNIKYQVRSCDDSACSGENFVGPANLTSAYYSEALNTDVSAPSFLLTDLPNNRYFQYTAQLLTTSTIYNTNITPEISQVTIGPDHYYGGEPTINASTTSAVIFGGELTGFTASEGGTGDVRYQITNQGDLANPTWYYWNNSNWVPATQSNHYNSSSTVNSHISQFSTDVGGGSFSWKAFLRSPNATESVSLASASVAYGGPTLTASDAPLNTKAANLVISPSYFDAGSYKTIPDWRVGGNSLAVLNMPFEAHAATSTTALDYSQSGFNGTATNGPTFSTSSGRDGFGAYTFDGINDYITVSHRPTLALTNNFTVTGWVKRSVGSSGWDGFITKATYSAAATTGWGITYDGTTARYAGFVACNGSVAVIPADTGTASSTDYAWRHVALKVDSGTTYFYVDGVQQKYHSDQQICDSGSAVMMGRYYSNAFGHDFKGALDEMAIWNRVLSDEQILALANLERDRIVAGETAVGEAWSVSVSQNNGITDVLTELTDSVTILARANTTPVISGINLNYRNYWVKAGQTLNINILSCNDEDGDTVSYRWTVDGVTAASTQSFAMAGSNYSAGQHTVVGICTDADNNSDSTSLTIEVLNSTDFSIVSPTNMAYLSQYYPGIMDKQARWINETKESLSTQFVSYIGDLVIDGGVASHWSKVSSTLAILHASSTPFFSAIGNHDYDDNLVEDNTGTRNTINFDTYLPYTRYQSQSWWGGQKDSSSVNTYQFFTVESVEYMMLNLEFCPSNTTLDWANSLVASYPNKNVIVNVHSYLNYDGELLTNQALGCQSFFAPSYVAGTDKNNGQQIWDEFAKLHKNIFMVLSGHVLGDGVDYRIDQATDGNDVHQIFHYEYGSYTGADEHTGSTAMLIFKPSENLVQFRDYDPWFDEFATSSGHTFSFYLGASSTPSIAGLALSQTTNSLTITAAADHLSNSQYFVENTTLGNTSGWQAGTTWTDSSLACNTTYSYRVKAKNTFGFVTGWSSAISVKTTACGSAVVPVTTPPTIPKIKTYPPQNILLSNKKETLVLIDGVYYPVYIESFDAVRMRFWIKNKTPLYQAVKNKPMLVDLDNNKKGDIQVIYNGITQTGKLSVTFSKFDSTEKAPVLINHGYMQTDVTKVNLSFIVSGAVQMAIANEPSFANATFVPFKNTATWNLTPTLGMKTVFVRFRSAAGGTIDSSASIELVKNSISTVNSPCLLKQNIVYKTPSSSSITFLTDHCTKRYVADEKSYLAFFTTWAVIVKTDTPTLANVPDDELGMISISPGKNQTIVFTKKLVIGSTGTEVKNLQTILAKGGFFPPDSITGKFGSITKNSLIKWQKKVGVPTTGQLDTASKTKLNLMILNGQATW